MGDSLLPMTHPLIAISRKEGTDERPLLFPEGASPLSKSRLFLEEGSFEISNFYFSVLFPIESINLSLIFSGVSLRLGASVFPGFMMAWMK